VLDTDYGSMYGAYRPAGPGQNYWRIAQFLFPFWTMTPTGLLGHHLVARAWVPMDDEHMIRPSPRAWVRSTTGPRSNWAAATRW